MKLNLNPLTWPVIRDLKWPHISKSNIFCWKKMCAGHHLQCLEESFNTEKILFSEPLSGPSPVVAKSETSHYYLDDASFIFVNWCIEDVMDDGEGEEEGRGRFGGSSFARQASLADDSYSLMSGVSNTIFFDSDFLDFGLELSDIGGLRGLFGSSFSNTSSFSFSSSSSSSSFSSSPFATSFTGRVF